MLQREGETGAPVNHRWHCKLAQPLRKAVQTALKKLKSQLPDDPALVYLSKESKNTNSKGYMDAHIHNSIIYNKQNMETI